MKLSDTFRPQKDALALRNFNEVAWQAKSDSFSGRVKSEASEVLTVHLEKLYPVQEMETLVKWGFARKREEGTILVQTPLMNSWSEHLSVPLSRPVLMPDGMTGVYCGGEWYSETPNRGLNSKTIAEIKAGQHDLYKSWEDFCASQNAKEAKRLPRELESLMFEIIEVRLAYKAEYRAISDWPKQHKAEAGAYPTWQEIADKFPVAGEEIRKCARQNEERAKS